MPQHEVEVILARHLASYLAIPIFLVDPEGNLLFYNEPAEFILGRRFEETGKMTLEEWSTTFTPTNEDGTPIPPEEVPLVVALTRARPTHRELYIQGLDGVRRAIQATAIPLVGQGDRLLGAVALFWEVG